MIPALAARPLRVVAFVMIGTAWCLLLFVLALCVSAVAGVCALVDWARRA